MKSYMARFLPTQKFLKALRTTFSFCNMNHPQSFREAVFADHLSAMRISPGTPEFKKYSYIMEINEGGEAGPDLDWLQQADIQTLSTSLEFISILSHKHQRLIIEVQSYAKILENYYQRFSLHNQRALINKVINPSLNLRPLLPSFVHTGNGKILETLKMNQFNLIELLSKSTVVKIEDFMRIISPRIYNNTDLPLINKHFFHHFYPQVSQIDTVAQLQKVIIYLSRFESIPVHLIRHSFKVLKKQLQEDSSHNLFDDYLSVANCIGLLLFRANNACKMADINELFYLHFELSNKPFKIKERTLNLIELQDEEILGSVIDELSCQVSQNISFYIQQLKQKDINSGLPPLVKNILQTHMQYLPSLHSESVKKLVELQLMPIITKFFLSQIQMKVANYASAIKFVNSPRFINFCANYPCYPHIYKELLLTMALFQQNHQENLIKSDILLDQVSNFKKQVDFYLSHTLKQGDRQNILKHYSPSTAFRTGYQQGNLWSLQGETLACRLMAMRQDYSLGNILGMLKEDNHFLWSRMKYNKRDIQEYEKKQKVELKKGRVSQWEYPLLYTTELNPNAPATEKIPRILYDRFTKDTFLSVDPTVIAKLLQK